MGKKIKGSPLFGTTETPDILVEAHKINYRLRSTFFYRKLFEYNTIEFPNTINQLIGHSNEYSWDDYEKWGISETAHSVISKSELNLIQVFAHPKLLREHPKLVGYYRNVSVLSQKSVKYLVGIDCQKYEEDSRSINDIVAVSLSKLFNEHISLIIESAFGKFRIEEINGLLFASTGAQIDGSWRNAIGDEAEKVVQIMLVKEALEKGMLTAFIMRDNGNVKESSFENTELIVKNIRSIKGIMLSNKKSILFSSEPDLTLVGRSGQSELVIEVKGGTDPAGALERYGAAKKSFEHSLAENKAVLTYFLASCITTEVEERITRDTTISKYFNLTAILTDESIKAAFLFEVFKVVES